jgi:serine/threonine protein kinase
VAKHTAFPICYGSFPDEKQNVWWVVDQWIEGRTLAEVRKDSPLRAEILPRVMKEIAEALRTMHEASIVRRELSPTSILLRSPEQSVVLTDFELAKLLDNNPTVSKDWEDDQYRAPEVKTGDVDIRADVYSWARILTHAVLGREPGSEKEDIAELDRSRLPEQVVQMARRCLSRPRSKRPDNMQVVLRALDDWN